MIEEVAPSGHSLRTVMSTIPDSEAEEFSDPGFPGDGGSDGDMGSDLCLWRGT